MRILLLVLGVCLLGAFSVVAAEGADAPSISTFERIAQTLGVGAALALVVGWVYRKDILEQRARAEKREDRFADVLVKAAEASERQVAATDALTIAVRELTAGVQDRAQEHAAILAAAKRISDDLGPIDHNVRNVMVQIGLRPKEGM